MAEPTYAQVSQILKYDPDSGKLFWLSRQPELFLDRNGKRSGNAARWNGRWAGKQAFTAKLNGYLIGRIFDVAYYAHRVAWLLAHEEWPTEQIDHINGQRHDNRLSNLRPVSHEENSKNRGLQSNNTSGVVGVSWYGATNRWQAYITVDKKMINLGSFEDMTDAIRVRQNAELTFGFHPNHGRPT